MPDIFGTPKNVATAAAAASSNSNKTKKPAPFKSSAENSEEESLFKFFDESCRCDDNTSQGLPYSPPPSSFPPSSPSPLPSSPPPPPHFDKSNPIHSPLIGEKGSSLLSTDGGGVQRTQRPTGRVNKTCFVSLALIQEFQSSIDKILVQ